MATMGDLGRRIVAGEVEHPPVCRLVGMVATHIEPGRCVFELQVDQRHHNPMGTLHGGIYCDLADAAMGMAYAATLAEGESFTTLELKINFFRPLRQGKLVAEARLVNAGRTQGYLECDVRDEQGRLMARAASTCLKFAPAQAG
ncbi:MAG: PaaI family thioesterase [Candidatus Eremiobacterota bacterium]